MSEDRHEFIRWLYRMQVKTRMEIERIEWYAAQTRKLKRLLEDVFHVVIDKRLSDKEALARAVEMYTNLINSDPDFRKFEEEADQYIRERLRYVG